MSEERNGLIKQRRLLREKCKQKDKEIERLNKLLDETRLSELHKEYIINELEKWLKKEHENGYEVYYLMAIQDILDKLTELKEK